MAGPAVRPTVRRPTPPARRSRAVQAPAFSLGGSGRTSPSATTSLASRTRRFAPSGIRNFWYSRSRCCLTAASVTTRSAAISRAVAGATNASSDRAGRHSEVTTSSSRRVSSGAAGRRSSTSAASSSATMPNTRQRADPKLSTSPSSRTRRATRRPLTRVPLRDNPRSRHVGVGPAADDLGVQPGDARIGQVDIHRPAPPDRGHILPQRHHEPAVLDPDVGAIHEPFLLPVGAATDISLFSYPSRRFLYLVRRHGLIGRDASAGAARRAGTRKYRAGRACASKLPSEPKGACRLD